MCTAERGEIREEIIKSQMISWFLKCVTALLLFPKMKLGKKYEEIEDMGKIWA